MVTAAQLIEQNAGVAGSCPELFAAFAKAVVPTVEHLQSNNIQFCFLFSRAAGMPPAIALVAMPEDESATFTAKQYQGLTDLEVTRMGYRISDVKSPDELLVYVRDTKRSGLSAQPS